MVEKFAQEEAAWGVTDDMRLQFAIAQASDYVNPANNGWQAYYTEKYPNYPNQWRWVTVGDGRWRQVTAGDGRWRQVRAGEGRWGQVMACDDRKQKISNYNLL